MDELKDIYRGLKNSPYLLFGIEITFENSQRMYLNSDFTLKIEGYSCYIGGKYFDLRKDIIHKITFNAKT